MDHRSSCAARVAILLAIAAPAARARAQDPHAAPALVVLVSVDQLATWVLDAALPALERADGGFRRLIEGGTSFPNCADRHGCTTTGPGHATLALRDAYGAPPDGSRSWLRGRSGGWLYLDRGALAARGIDVADAAATAAASAVGIEGVLIAVPTVGEVEPPPELAAILRDSVHPQRTGDLWLVLEPYWLGSPQPIGSHGSPWDCDRDVPLLAYGCGIRPGLSLDLPITPGTAVVIAAALCGIEPPVGATDPLPRAALLAPPADAAH